MCNNTKKYTITQFREDYPDDNACLNKLFQLRYGKLDQCPRCKLQTEFKRVSSRQCYQCSKCYYQIYPCAGTIFHRTRTPLIQWFYVIYLFTASKNGISAYEVQRQLGVTYKTAWRMLKQIRTLLATDNTNRFFGTVELDETFVGGKNKNRHKDKKVQHSQGRSFKDKTPVFGLYERDSKIVRTVVIPDTKGTTIKPLVYSLVDPIATIMTDEWLAYTGLNLVYSHSYVNHAARQYTDGAVTTNRIENFWSVFKRTLNGSYVHVSAKYLQLYADEVTFRFNNRNSEQPIFSCLLNLLT